MSRLSAKNVVNITGGVELIDGRKLYGMDAEHYLKMQAKLDPEFELNLGKWIQSVLGTPLEDPADLHVSLKSGIVLCQMLNKLKPGIIKKFNLPKGTSTKIHPLMERENIGIYLEACWKLGVPSHDMFVTPDLHAKRYMHQVLQNISAVSQMARGWGFKGEAVAPVTKPPEKVIVPGVNEPPPKPALTRSDSGIVVEDFDTAESELVEIKKQLSEAQRQIKQAEEERQSLQKKLSGSQTQGGDQSKKYQDDISALQKELSALKEQLQSGRKELNEAKEQLQTEKRDISGLKDQLQRERMEGSSLKQQLSNERNRRQTTSAQTAAQSAQVSRDKEEISRIAGQIEEIKKQVTIAQQDKDTEIRKFGRLRQSFQQLEENLKKETAEKEQIKKVNQEMVKNNQQLTKQNQELQKTYQQLTKQNQEIQIAKEQLDTQLRMKARELQRLEQQLKPVQRRPIQRIPTKQDEVTKPPVQIQPTMQVLPGTDIYYDPKELDIKTIQSLREELRKIAEQGVDIDTSLVSQWNESLMTKDSGRRIFTYLLKHMLKGKTNLKLSTNSLQLLLCLIQKALENMHISKPADYISARIILESSPILYFEEDGSRKYIKEFIADHFLWQHLGFWEDYFWDIISAEFSTYMESVPDEEKAHEELVFITDRLKKYVRTMWGWGKLAPETIELLVSRMADKHKLTEEQKKEVIKETYTLQLPSTSSPDLDPSRRKSLSTQPKKSVLNAPKKQNVGFFRRSLNLMRQNSNEKQ
eukprot:TRINITY_DN515_c0_g6_i1.p1 TRINITY_DN515_c0_g6~~TRINITY_DN515_c0_g6_i1.p1  ORF type:complete len:754 (+),score=184.41 TRINITY_DN515_c0_g6_i1:140-2401(+)